MVFHERKEESKNTEASKPKKATSDKPPEYNQSQVQASIFSHSMSNDLFVITMRAIIE